MKISLLLLITNFGTGLVFADTEVARVNQRPISIETVQAKLKESSQYFQVKNPSRRSILDDLIKRELLVQEAKRIGLEKDASVQDRFDTVLFNALIEKKLNPTFEAIKVSDDEARNYYKKFPEIRTSHIFISVPQGTKKEQEQAALNRIKSIQKNQLSNKEATFAEVAQKFSEGSAAPMGGDIDYQTKEKLDPAYYETAVKLGAPGKVSDIVRTQYGYHIIKLTGIKSWDDADRGAIKRAIYEEKRTELFEQYVAQLKKKAKISIRNELLKD